LGTFETQMRLNYTALLIGSSGTLGRAFADHLQQDPDCSAVHSVSRTSHPAFDLRTPTSFDAVVLSLASLAPFDLIIDATGALTIDGVGPEKSLRSLNESQLMRAFQINTIGPALLLRALAPLLNPAGGLYAKLSARVGSIGDNKKGGWYSYRASKAAMNMVLQTAALELQRRQAAHRIIALQPGTVLSNLSAPFVQAGTQTLSAPASVAGMMQAIKNAPHISGASFLDYQGHPITW
jgi:NAD(P)-dependent dehydrogenase (short-subunit alcohol dehydrogenase family)